MPKVERLRAAVVENSTAFDVQLDAKQLTDLETFYELLLKWNERLHLVAPCTPEYFAVRHLLESLWLLRHVQTNTHILDVGSGGGLPAIPCLLARHDVSATLVESSVKKTVFLKEAVRILRLADRTKVIASRFEEIKSPPADYVTVRAIDRFAERFPEIVRWSPEGSTPLLFAGDDLRREVERQFPETKAELLPQSERRFLLVLKRPA